MNFFPPLSSSISEWIQGNFVSETKALSLLKVTGWSGLSKRLTKASVGPEAMGNKLAITTVPEQVSNRNWTDKITTVLCLEHTVHTHAQTVPHP